MMSRNIRQGSVDWKFIINIHKLIRKNHHVVDSGYLIQILQLLKCLSVQILKQLLSQTAIRMDFQDSDIGDNVADDIEKQYCSIKPPRKGKLSEQIYKLYINPIILSIDHFYIPPARKTKSEICAKVLKNGDLLVQCYDCRIDNTCCICIQCFNNGDHKNHKYRIRQAGGGCCDCGDKQAWKQKGFCKNHSGKHPQFQIEKQTVKKTKKKLHEILYLYFYFNLQQKNQQKTIKYSQKLIEILININKNNIYYNKLTYLCLCCPFQFQINKEFDKFTVLENILNPQVSISYYEGWVQFFIILFGYYPFKLQLLKSFIQRYGSIAIHERALSFCGSLSCQLLTSYQLVQKYAAISNIGIGQCKNYPRLNKEPNSKKTMKFYSRMYHDLEYVNKLQKSSSLAYWQMHIKNQRSLDNIFQYYEDLLQFAQNSHENNLSFNGIIYMTVETFPLEFELFELFVSILKVAKNSNVIINFVVKYLWDKLIKTFARKQSNFIPIFRPYDRAFCLTLFTLFNFQFQYPDKIQSYRGKLCQILKITIQQLEEGLKHLQQRLFQTYFIYSKTVMEAGFGQSMYHYIYFYKLKYKAISAIDVLSIKITLLLRGKCEPLDLRSLIGLKNEQDFDVKQKKMFLDTILTFIRYLYTLKTNQIYIAHLLDPTCIPLEGQLTDFLLRFFNINNGIVTIQKLNLIKNKLFNSSMKAIEDWLQKNTVLNKEKRQFVIKTHISGSSINLRDVWQSEFLNDSPPFSDPFITLQCIKNQNLVVFFSIWSSESINTLIELADRLYQKNIQLEGAQRLLSEILLLFILSSPDSQNFIKLKQFISPLVDKFPNHVIEKLKEKGLLNQDIENTEKVDDKVEKKKRVQAIKQKKMEKMRQKQEKAFSSLQMEEQEPQFLKKISDSTLGCEFESQVCCICRNEENIQLGYLVRVEERDYERLFKLGPGKKTICFYSCFHAFHHKCIKNLLNKKFCFPCPVCKISMQIYLGLPNKDISILHCNELNLQIFSTGCIEEQRPFEDISIQIINSIYHFMLTLITNRRQNIEKQVQLYRILFFYLRKSMKIKDLQENQAKMQKIQPTKQEQQKTGQKRTKKNAIKKQSALTRKIKQQGKQRISQTPIQNEIDEINNCDKISPEKKMETQPDFLYPKFIRIIFLYLKALLLNSDLSNLLDPMQEGTQAAKSKFIIEILGILSREYSDIQEQISLNFNLPFNPHFIINLPNLYSGLDQDRVCSTCSQVSSNIVLCLICSWRGCFLCKKGKKNNTLCHSDSSHGSSMGIYMKLDSSLVFYQNKFGRGIVGYLYENQWGQSIQKNFEWDRFELNKNLINSIQKTLVMDKVLTKLKENNE